MSALLDKLLPTSIFWNFLDDSDGKESICNAGNLGWIHGSRSFPEEGNGSPPKYSCMENSMEIGAWGATVHGVEKSPGHD